MVKEKKISGIKSWPADDRPREKLLKKGAGALSNTELLAILLRTGTNGSSAIDIARKVMKKFGTFRNMVHTDARDWKEFKGLGSAKTAHIQAALEIGRRFREDEVSTGKQKISSAKDVVDIVMPQLRDLKTEISKVVEPEATKIAAQLVENDRLKQYRWTTGTLPSVANFPGFGENTKTDATLLRNKLEINHKKQLNLWLTST